MTQKGVDSPSPTEFPVITPHDLRHTAASLAVSAGANVKAVQRMLGHAKTSMTLGTYADLFDTNLDAVAGAGQPDSSRRGIPLRDHCGIGRPSRILQLK